MGIGGKEAILRCILITLGAPGLCVSSQNGDVNVKFGIMAAAAKSLQSRPTLCDPIDGSPPGSLIPGILQTRILEWVAISFSSA